MFIHVDAFAKDGVWWDDRQDFLRRAASKISNIVGPFGQVAKNIAFLLRAIFVVKLCCALCL